MPQTQAVIADIIGRWARGRTFPQGWAWPNGTLKQPVEDELVKIVEDKYEGVFTFSALEAAYALKIAQAQQAREQRQQQERLVQHQLVETDVVLNSNPTLIRGDRAHELITNWWKLHPQGVAAELETYLKTKSDDGHLWSDAKPIDMVALVRNADKNKLAELTQGYGEERVRKALEDLQKKVHKYSEAARPSWLGDTTAKKEADAAAALRVRERDPKEILQATAACQAIVDRFSAGSNHAETKRAKTELAQIVVKTDGVFDAFRTREAREAWVRAYVSEAGRKH